MQIPCNIHPKSLHASPFKLKNGFILKQEGLAFPLDKKRPLEHQILTSY